MASEQPTGFSEQIAAEQPANTTILVTGMDSQTWIVLPDSGTLWVAYEYSDQPAVMVIIWHQGGSTETVEPGFQTFNVDAGDALMYQLVEPTQSIKLGWAYI
jgi:hypothetical protein